MLFNSVEFLLFFPATVLGFFLIPKKLKTLWLLAASYYFYMCWNVRHAVLIAVSTAVSWAGGLLMGKPADDGRRLGRKLVLAVCCMVNMGILFFYKYFDFALANLNVLFQKAGMPLLDKPFDVLLPAGLLGLAGFSARVTPGRLRLMRRGKEFPRLALRGLRLYPGLLPQILRQGLPTGVQNAVISVGNIVIQSNINSFGEFAMSGHGAYVKLEGLVFLPIMSMSMALPTFISQNLGARQYDRAKKGAVFGILSGVAVAELIGLLFLAAASPALGAFVDQPEAIRFGSIHARTVAPFFCMLAFTYCAGGVLRGCGRSFVPMITMLAFWCCVRVTYVTLAVRAFPVFQTISWAYPLTWTLSSIVLLVFLLRSDWTHSFDRAAPHAA